jgi:hypothetical protein
MANRKNFNPDLINGSRESTYKTINTIPFQNKRLSIQAKGTLIYLLSKPKNWKGQLYDIQANNANGRDAIRAAIKELEAEGYMELKSYPRKEGQFQGKYYEFYDKPKRKKKVYETPTIEKVTDKSILPETYPEPWMDGVINQKYINN